MTICFLTFVIYDEFNQRALHIKNNQIYYSVGIWDIQLVGTKLTIREAQRKILIEIIFQPPNKVIIERGRFLLNGVEIIIRPDSIFITNTRDTLRENTARNVNFGLVVGESNTDSGLIIFTKVPRYSSAMEEGLKLQNERLEVLLKRLEEYSNKK